ncbi:DUF3046 domain-containing protein [Psychromicrobium lacuslunae]|uniref:Histidine kinase n=1 Tax=Psychromicrobium lacuslunae TaxID=1618207 RepID=A0A0D4BVY5_9MICC|nr:DUF3046 domain-containing protein [Psychromicrobium lacuslunae]AJT40587.1 histidine kinase [Psychromicrobium lacuslunae]
MRLSEFWRLMAEEFGEGYAASLANDMVLDAVGGRTAREALEAGVPPRSVWQALCEAKDVPVERRLGKDIKPSS